jgi:hypothetical protein
MSSGPCVLIVVEQPLRDSLASALRTNGFEALECHSRVDAVRVLESRAADICYAVLAPDATNAWEVTELLVSEYPGIERLVLSP